MLCSQTQVFKCQFCSIDFILWFSNLDVLFQWSYLGISYLSLIPYSGIWRFKKILKKFSVSKSRFWYYNFAVRKSRLWHQKLRCRSLNCTIIIFSVFLDCGIKISQCRRLDGGLIIYSAKIYIASLWVAKMITIDKSDLMIRHLFSCTPETFISLMIVFHLKWLCVTRILDSVGVM